MSRKKGIAALAAVLVAAAVPAAPAFAGTGDGAKECVENAKGALVDLIEGTPQPQTCRPLG